MSAYDKWRKNTEYTDWCCDCDRDMEVAFRAGMLAAAEIAKEMDRKNPWSFHIQKIISGGEVANLIRQAAKEE